MASLSLAPFSFPSEPGLTSVVILWLRTLFHHLLPARALSETGRWNPQDGHRVRSLSSPGVAVSGVSSQLPTHPALLSHPPRTIENAHPPTLGFPHSSVDKESTCNAGDPGLIPRLGRSPGDPTPVFWPGEFLGLYSPWGSQRVGHD